MFTRRNILSKKFEYFINNKANQKIQNRGEPIKVTINEFFEGKIFEGEFSSSTYDYFEKILIQFFDNLFYIDHPLYEINCNHIAATAGIPAKPFKE